MLQSAKGFEDAAIRDRILLRRLSPEAFKEPTPRQLAARAKREQEQARAAAKEARRYKRKMDRIAAKLTKAEFQFLRDEFYQDGYSNGSYDAAMEM